MVSNREFKVNACALGSPTALGNSQNSGTLSQRGVYMPVQQWMHLNSIPS